MLSQKNQIYDIKVFLNWSPNFLFKLKTERIFKCFCIYCFYSNDKLSVTGAPHQNKNKENIFSIFVFK